MAHPMKVDQESTHVVVSPQMRMPVGFLTDEPRYASAALSISLYHLHMVEEGAVPFRPEYTHQCVGESETFSGYRPPRNVLDQELGAIQQMNQKQNLSKQDKDKEEATQTETLLHKSHQGHDTATAELEVQVFLSPSCETCQVQLHIHPLTTTCCEPAAKRVKFQQKPDDPTKILSETDILNAMRVALPPIQEPSKDNIQVYQKFLAGPLGVVLEEYTVEKDQNPMNFVLSLADGQDPIVANYHNKVQPLALFYIENADMVNVAATDNGYWKILYIFRRHSVNNRYSLVGYFTLFHFIALFHKPQPGIIVRICQALILPPYQGQGHGSRMMQAVYKLAHRQYKATVDNDQNDIDSSNPHTIIQVNVEDPAPAFVALRNNADYVFVETYGHELGWPEGMRDTTNLDATFFTSLTETQAMDLSSKIKITTKQIHMVNDMIKFKTMRNSLDSADIGNNMNQLEGFFRLMVKKRLNREHREELGALKSKEEQKTLLAVLFEERLNGYKRIITCKSKK
jgi:histone acetyltransferase 1